MYHVKSIIRPEGLLGIGSSACPTNPEATSHKALYKDIVVVSTSSLTSSTRQDSENNYTIICSILLGLCLSMCVVLQKIYTKKVY